MLQWRIYDDTKSLAHFKNATTIMLYMIDGSINKSFSTLNQTLFNNENQQSSETIISWTKLDMIMKSLNRS